MKLLDRSTFASALGIVALGIAFGVVSNLGAGPSRRLEWTRDYPEETPRKKHCPDTLPDSPDAPPVAPVETAPEPAAPVGETLPDRQPPAPDAIPTPATPAAVSAPQASAPVVPPPAPATAPAAAPPTATAPAAELHAVTIPPVPASEPFVELTPQQVDLLYDRHSLFIDARMTSQFEEGHVAGALSIPIWEAGVPDKIAAAVFEVEGDKSRPIVIYCNGGECEDSHNLARMFFDDGYSALYVYKDGYPDWLTRARPIHAGATR
jgi:rhodanese-related sulfurtransferase